MGGGVSKKYKLQEHPNFKDLPTRKLLQPTDHFHGKCKPHSPDGVDTGLQEIYQLWSFPDNTDTRLVIRPQYRAFKFASFTLYKDWDPRVLSGKAYKEQAGSKVHALLPEDEFNRFVQDCNMVLDQIDDGDECQELLSKLTTRAQNSGKPDLTWSLHCHRYASALAASALVEHRFFTIEIAVNTGVEALASKKKKQSVQLEEAVADRKTGHSGMATIQFDAEEVEKKGPSSKKK